MSEKYEYRWEELVAEMEEYHCPGGVVLPEEVKRCEQLLSMLAQDSRTARDMRRKNLLIDSKFISWMLDFQATYEPLIANEVDAYKADITYYNILYCIMDRWKLKIQHDQRKVTISYDKFCEYIKWNKTTCSKKNFKLTYTKEEVLRLWHYYDYDAQKNKNLIKIIKDIATLMKEELEKR